MRLDSNQAQRVVRTATSHQFWSKPHSIYRREMIRVLELCAPRLRRQDLAVLADRTLAAVRETKNDFDYPDALNLLCNISSRANDALKKKVAKTLYPKGSTADMFLVQAAVPLGKELGNAEEWSKLAERSAKNLRLQVQRLSAGQEPEKPFGSFGQFIHIDSQQKNKVVVHIASSTDLDALAAHRRAIPSRSLEHLADTALDMIQESENLLNNRELLIGWLPRVADRLPMKTALRVLRTLVPISKGQIVEPTIVMSAEEAENPLNPFKLRTGSPAELRGAALLALAEIREAKPRLRAEAIDKPLENALTDSDAFIRRSAFRAIMEAPRTSRSCLSSGRKLLSVPSGN